MSVYKNITLVGAGGSLGTPLLKALLAEPSFEVTIIRRASSKSQIPASRAKIITVPDSYPVEALTKAFQGQDAVINALASESLLDQTRIIDAAAAAGVKRFVPSEFGLDNANPSVIALSPIFKYKNEVRDYVKTKFASSGMSWTSFATGPWISWVILHSFLGINRAEKKFTITDDGNALFSTTTLPDIAAAVVAALKKPEETANRFFRLSNFATTQNQLFDAIERLSGEKYERVYLDSTKTIEDAHRRWDAGDKTAAYTTIEMAFVSGKFGGNLEKEGPLANELLGVPTRNLDDVVKDALAAL